jgi:hypothetical protein
MTDRIYYTYAYLREDGTPYYIGRGKGRRAFDITHRIKVPPKGRVLILKQNLTYEEASEHEIYMIAVLGRKDLGTGILRNLTNGGEGRPGPKPQDEVEKIRKSNTGKVIPDEVRRKISKAKTGVPVHSDEEKEKRRLRLIKNNPNASGSSTKGKKVWNDGLTYCYSETCPGEGWVLGKLGEGGFKGKSHSETQCRKFSEDRKKRRHWVNKEGKTKFQETCPGEGWVPGRKWKEV